MKVGSPILRNSTLWFANLNVCSGKIWCPLKVNFNNVSMARNDVKYRYVYVHPDKVQHITCKLLSINQHRGWNYQTVMCFEANCSSQLLLVDVVYGDSFISSQVLSCFLWNLNLYMEKSSSVCMLTTCHNLWTFRRNCPILTLKHILN